MNTLIKFKLIIVIVTIFGVSSFAFANENHIQYNGRISLGYTLKDIANKTGIKFFVPEEIAQQVIKARVNTKNWKTAVHQLLEEYSTLEMWSDDLASSKVWVYGKDGNNLSGSTIQRGPRQTSTSVASRPTARTLQASNPPKVSKTSAREENPLSQLPPHIRHDPEVLRFLFSKGVEMPGDVKAKYGDQLENLPPERPIFPHVAKNASFVRFLKSLGLRPPTG